MRAWPVRPSPAHSTRLRNAMKAAVRLLDIELSQMNSEIRAAYLVKPDVLGIFPVAAYNGSGRNVAKLYRALNRMDLQLDELRRAGKLSPGHAVEGIQRLTGWSWLIDSTRRSDFSAARKSSASNSSAGANVPPLAGLCRTRVQASTTSGAETA
jgi:hypothetical protein